MITIHERLRPFSHQPGMQCLIPGTAYIVEAFPARVRVRDFNGALVKEINLEIQGPLQQFTLMQDLERGCVTIFSEVYRFHLLPNLEVIFQKNPPLPPFKVQERLSLGCHKKQEWEAIKKRGDLREIFPIWLRLGQSLDLPLKKKEESGMFSLLKRARTSIEAHRPEKILSHFKKLFLAGFGHMLVPRAHDEDHQGILEDSIPPSEASPLYLLQEGSALIRSLFVMAADNEISILPNVPPDFFAGRMLAVNILPYGILHFEWSKKTIKRVYFEAHTHTEMIFHFPSQMRTFRMRTHLKERGQRLACGDSLEIKSGTHYLLDQFQK